MRDGKKMTGLICAPLLLFKIRSSTSHLALRYRRNHPGVSARSTKVTPRTSGQPASAAEAKKKGMEVLVVVVLVSVSVKGVVPKASFAAKHSSVSLMASKAVRRVISS